MRSLTGHCSRARRTMGALEVDGVDDTKDGAEGAKDRVQVTRLVGRQRGAAAGGRRTDGGDEDELEEDKDRDREQLSPRDYIGMTHLVPGLGSARY